GALIWRTRSVAKNWQKAMQALAQLRSDLNRSFESNPQRALSSYPVTKKSIREWDSQTRLPNSLRLKIVEEKNGLHGLVFHMPCRPNDDLWRKHPFNGSASRLAQLWQGVHRQIDNNSEFERVSA